MLIAKFDLHKQRREKMNRRHDDLIKIDWLKIGEKCICIFVVLFFIIFWG